jgi:hypothetical protein
MTLAVPVESPAQTSIGRGPETAEGSQRSAWHGDRRLRSWCSQLSPETHATYHLISDMHHAGRDQHSVGCIPQPRVRVFPDGVASQLVDNLTSESFLR